MTINVAWCLSNNFGDALAPWLAKKITGQDPVYCSPNPDFEHYIITGSILNWATRKSIVWGAGLANYSDLINTEVDVRAVRGPITRLRCLSLGIKCRPIYGDPSLLLPRFYEPKRNRPRAKVGLVPHYIDQVRVFPNYKSNADIKVINILDGVESVVEDIVTCDKIVSSSLHGLCVADAYGIPNVLVKFSDSIGGDGLKFLDYFLSVGRMEKVDGINFLDVRDNPVRPTDYWVNLSYGLGKVNADPLMAFCPFDPKGDPVGAAKKYL